MTYFLICEMRKLGMKKKRVESVTQVGPLNNWEQNKTFGLARTNSWYILSLTFSSLLVLKVY